MSWISGIGMLSLASFLCLSCTQYDEERLIVDVNRIVNKYPDEVEEILGKPDSVYILQMMGRSIFCQLYKDPCIEIQYPQSRATDIVVYGATGLPFSQTALAAFNLDYRNQHPSDYRRGSFIRWRNFRAFSAISIYNPKTDSLNNITAFDIFLKAREVSAE